MTARPDVTALAEALADASRTHHEYETVVLKGVRHAQWSGFYAAFVLGRLGDFTSASKLSRLLEEVDAPADWSSAAAAHVVAALSR